MTAIFSPRVLCLLRKSTLRSRSEPKFQQILDSFVALSLLPYFVNRSLSSKVSICEHFFPLFFVNASKFFTHLRKCRKYVFRHNIKENKIKFSCVGIFRSYKKKHCFKKIYKSFSRWNKMLKAQMSGITIFYLFVFKYHRLKIQFSEEEKENTCCSGFVLIFQIHFSCKEINKLKIKKLRIAEFPILGILLIVSFFSLNWLKLKPQ